MKHPPRRPTVRIFNRIMVGRALLSAFVIGGVGFAVYHWLLANGWAVVDARNSLLLLMVLFENVHVANYRSETRSAFLLSPFRNRLQLFGTLAAQLINIAAMHTPGLSAVLGVHGVTLLHWTQLLLIALSLLVVMETRKWVYNKRSKRP